MKIPVLYRRQVQHLGRADDSDGAACIAMTVYSEVATSSDNELGAYLLAQQRQLLAVQGEGMRCGDGLHGCHFQSSR